MVDEAKRFMGIIQKSMRSGSMERWEDRGGCIWAKVKPGDLVPACEASMGNGAVFDSAFISPQGEKAGFTVYYLFRLQDSGKMLVLQSQGKEFAALSAKANAALWDERKMQDLTGLKLQDIPDQRPLLFHPEGILPQSHPMSGKPMPKQASRTYPMKGTGVEGEFEIAVGPVHAGIIEPGHFRFHVVGEKINKMEVRMFYLHRGLESAVEGKAPADILPTVEQISGDESVANSVAYCYAVERALSLKVPERAEYIRAVLLEMERIYSHLSDLGGMPTDVGFTLSASRFAVLREDMMRLNRLVSGNRFLRGVCAVGGVSKDLGAKEISAIKEALALFEKRLDGVERMTLTSSTYLDRVFSTGRVNQAVAKDLALVGPVARASGVSCDLRKVMPYSAYSAAGFSERTEKTGDVLARFLVKLAEVKESARLIKWLVSNLPEGKTRCEIKAQTGTELRTGVGWTEAPRGGCAFLVELSGEGRIRRLACRTASFRDWRGIEKAVEGNIVPDFPLINKSFNMSYAGTDL